MIRASIAVLALPALLMAAPPADPAAADLQSLIDDAPSGSTLRLAPGTYRGGVVIARPLIIEGGGGAVVDGAGTGSIITVTAPDVELHGLVLRRSGDSLMDEDAAVSAEEADRLVVADCRLEDVLFGVFLRMSRDAVVRDSIIGSKGLDPGRRGDSIRLWESPGAVIEGNTISGGRDAVAFYSDGIAVTGNVFRGGRYGVHFMYAGDSVVAGNRFEGNSVGAFVMYSSRIRFEDNVVTGSFGPSGYGLGLKDVDDAVITGNRFVGNRVGIYVDNSPISPASHQTVSGNLISYNDIGVMFTASVERNRFGGNSITGNGVPVAVSGADHLDGNEWEVGGIGNHWDGYRGFDADGDGIGDIPYRLDELYSAMMSRHPELALFAGTPAARAVDVAARLFPTIRPGSLAVDPAPLIDSPIAAPGGAGGSGRWGLLTVSAAMLAAAAAILRPGNGVKR